MWVETSKLANDALSWAVAMAVGHDLSSCNPAEPMYLGGQAWMPWAKWAQGGPIIDSIGGGVQYKEWLDEASKSETKCEFHIHNHEGNWIQFGPTHLVSAMRCYVNWKLGDEVDIPEVLCS